jgi:hypothetical protein
LFHKTTRPELGRTYPERYFTRLPASFCWTVKQNMGVSSPSTGAVERRIAASIDRWKRQLLDVSKRNRALNFKMSKVSTIAIIDEQPAEVFRQLCLKSEGMGLKAAAKREVRATAGPEGIHISDTLAEGELVRRAEEHLETPATPIDDEDGEAPSLDFFP